MMFRNIPSGVSATTRAMLRIARESFRGAKHRVYEFGRRISRSRPTFRRSAEFFHSFFSHRQPTSSPQGALQHDVSQYTVSDSEEELRNAQLDEAVGRYHHPPLSISPSSASEPTKIKKFRQKKSRHGYPATSVRSYQSQQSILQNSRLIPERNLLDDQHSAISAPNFNLESSLPPLIPGLNKVRKSNKSKKPHRKSAFSAHINPSVGDLQRLSLDVLGWVSNDKATPEPDSSPKTPTPKTSFRESCVMEDIISNAVPDFPNSPLLVRELHDDSNDLDWPGSATDQLTSEVIERTTPPCKPTKRSVHWFKSDSPLGPRVSSTLQYSRESSPSSEDSVLVHPSTHWPLSSFWDENVDRVMTLADDSPVASSHRGDPLTRRDMATCFTPGAWLNDNIINSYMELIVDHARQTIDNTGRHPKPSYHAFNSFFYSSLRDRGYRSVQRWALRARIGGESMLNVKTIFIPVHNHAHWTLIVVKPNDRTIEHFDSLGSPSDIHVQRVKQWLREELKGAYVESEWRVLDTPCPQQSNGSDCGVFLLTSAKLTALGQPLEYGPKDIPLIRRRIVAELINGGFNGDLNDNG